MRADHFPNKILSDHFETNVKKRWFFFKIQVGWIYMTANKYSKYYEFNGEKKLFFSLLKSEMCKYSWIIYIIE